MMSDSTSEGGLLVAEVLEQEGGLDAQLLVARLDDAQQRREALGLGRQRRPRARMAPHQTCVSSSSS